MNGTNEPVLARQQLDPWRFAYPAVTAAAMPRRPAAAAGCLRLAAPPAPPSRRRLPADPDEREGDLRRGHVLRLRQVRAPSPKGKAKLDDLVSKMKGMNLEVIIAVGHTDNIGTFEYNQKLSAPRQRSRTIW